MRDIVIIRKDTTLLLLNNFCLKLTNVWYSPNLDFNLISTIQLGKKRVEMCLQTIDEPIENFHNRVVPGYFDPNDGQYVFWLRKTLEFFTIANSADTPPKKKVIPRDIKLWYLRIEHLGYKSLAIIMNLSSQMTFKSINGDKLCWNWQKMRQNKPAIKKSYVWD